jgi:NAD(P)-dependent dehydrogenase (short-subunit alcohol dehydrogenase family)
VALVNGAGSGIGRATAVALGRAGAAVMVADVDDVAGAETVAQVQRFGGQAAYLHADVSTPAGIRAMFAATEDTFGGVDIVHNNAGISTGEPGWLEVPLERLVQVIAVNTTGVIMGTQAAVRAMRPRGGGVVVNTASIAAHNPSPNMPDYCASKAAVAMFTQCCAGLAESEGVRVNAVSPGMVRTDFQRKTGDGFRPASWLLPAIEHLGDAVLPPEAIAEAVLELIRDDGIAGKVRIVTNKLPSGDYAGEGFRR